MSDDHYERALTAALREYERAVADRASLDTRIAHLQQTIGTLNRLCGHEPSVPMGLTDACRMVLRSAGARLTPVEIRERLRGVGFDLDRYANALAAIHTVLKRMTESGEATSTESGEHTRAAYEFLESGWVASRTRGRASWATGGKKAAGVGLCPPKDRAKLLGAATVRKQKRPAVPRMR
jgi:hypothetical protein